MKVVIVGCGLGGLACAISCLRNGLEVTVLERAPDIQPVGAGIQIPPNATRVMQRFGLEQKIRDHGAVQISSRNLLRYSDGKTLCTRPGGTAMTKDFGAAYYVIHRADYHFLLLDEALRLGLDFRKGCEVADIDFGPKPAAILTTGEKVHANVLVGADGLYSMFRDKILGRCSPPVETGDLAFRGTFALERLQKLNDPGIDDLIGDQKAVVWMGPEKHCTFYPIRDGKEFNLVLAAPDTLPSGMRTSKGSVRELEHLFSGWDKRLRLLISCMNESLLKWKLCHHPELESWVKGNVVLLGDACHPSLPYQAQGAAMAVEDGAVLGELLGGLVRASKSSAAGMDAHIASILALYESLRKARTTTNVLGSVRNREMFNMPDGELQRRRDAELAQVDWQTTCPWQWGDPAYQNRLQRFDAVADAQEAFGAWAERAGVSDGKESDMDSPLQIT